MKYRILPAEEWDRLADIVPAKHLPMPEAATAAVAEEDDGKVVGVLFLQLQLHLEPLYIHDPHVSFRRLQETLHNAVADQKGLCYFALTDDPRVAKMAEICGMQRLNAQVYMKEVG